VDVCRRGTERSSRIERIPVTYSCAEDDGRPIGIGFQEQVPNQSELLRSKSRGGERRIKSPGITGAGGRPKAERKQTLEDASITIRVVKTGGGPYLWDQSVGCLMTGRTATGV
jgi:hypothetical protein